MANEPVDAGDRQRALQWERVNALFHAVLARQPDERAAFLATQCGTNGEFRAEVESLLAAHVTGTDTVSTRVRVGARIGDYEVTSFLAAGAMGEVYRARDTKLGRDVALKVLPPAFVADPDRRARFEREARVLASLNHPNIATIYGFVESAPAEPGRPISALALELVEGETLADRIARGRIPVEDALRIAKQIAEALEAAHEQGIIHRDLKPANIKLTRDGVVKVLDFGLAKLSLPDAASATMSSTTTGAGGMTAAGMLLGTPAYMSPEQARGETIDRRTDMWAFGCVLYEMLTSRAPFAGGAVTEVLARVLEREPAWSAVPAWTPASLGDLLRRCLVKERKNRLDSATAARLDIDRALEPSARDSVQARVVFPHRAVIVATAVALTFVAFLGVWRIANREGVPPSRQYALR